MLKKFEELTEEQQKLCYLMYSDKETVKKYLYNFDEKGKYLGRQFTPETGVIHAEGIKQTTKEVVNDIVEHWKSGKSPIKEVKPQEKKSRKK